MSIETGVARRHDVVGASVDHRLVRGAVDRPRRPGGSAVTSVSMTGHLRVPDRRLRHQAHHPVVLVPAQQQAMRDLCRLICSSSSSSDVVEMTRGGTRGEEEEGTMADDRCAQQ